MDCIIGFDSLNDVVYSKYNLKFSKHIKKLGLQQGLISAEECIDDVVNSNMLIQLFSPLVTSQRVMMSQFGNSYSSVQCKNGTNMAFDEYMGFMFVCIGSDSVAALQHTLGVFISFIRHVVGPDVTELKRSQRCGLLLDRLFDTWYDLRSDDQAILVEALEQLSVNPDVTCTAINALRDACNSLRSVQSIYDCTRSHAVVFVGSKLLALYSSREAEDLAPADVLFLNILSNYYSGGKRLSSQTSLTENVSGSRSPSINSDDISTYNTADASVNVIKVASELVLLKCKKVFVPHAVHVSNFGNGLTFLILYQICNESLCIGFDEVFTAITKFSNLVSSDSDFDAQKKSYEALENGMKRILDCFKKIKNKQEIEPLLKQLHSKWDFIKKKYSESVKNNEDICVNLSANAVNLLALLRQFYQAMCLTTTTELPLSHGSVIKIVQQAQKSLFDFTDFLKTKADHNFTLKSRAVLTINKYLEEFPGLVHFLYIDRSNHRVTAPFLHFSSEETNILTKKKIWEMVEWSSDHIRDGHLAFMWKDTTFNYSYFLWFEDLSGTPLKPKVNPMNVLKTLPMPGILTGDFYKSLIDACFPKMSAKVRCFELYCIHLGLATSSTVLDQSRRIAATVWEVTGQEVNNPNLESLIKI